MTFTKLSLAKRVICWCIRRWIRMDLFQERIVYQTDDDGKGEGCVYDGQWSEDGKRHGVGVLSFKDGVKYSGEFSNGFFHGYGVLIYHDGTTYEGSLQLGKFHGYGVYRNHEGMKYEGHFEDGSALGLGLVTFPDGSHGRPSCEGKFVGNECVERKHSGNAPKLARQAAAKARAITQH